MMMVRRASVACLMLVVVCGCAQDRPGVIRRLPPPVARRRPMAKPPVRRAPVRVAARPVVPTPIGVSAAGWWPPGGISNRWETIVIHHSGSAQGNAAIFDRYHRNVRHWNELGYHFVIGNGTDSGDGEIEVGSRWTSQKHGAHCKTPDNYYNEKGIGICLVGDFGATQPTEAQMESLAHLVGFLMRSCGIGIDKLVTHGGVKGGGTKCPGSNFSLSALRRRLPGG